MNILVIRILEILLVPYFNRDALWTIAPLIFALVMLQMYFGKYKTEQLGWNTAYGNTISLVWVTAILFKYFHETYGLADAWLSLEYRGYFFLIVGLGVFTLILAFLNFEHIMPKKLAFFLSSSLPTNGLAYFVLVIVLGKIPLDEVTFWASAFIFLFLTLTFWVYRKIITPSKGSLVTLKKHEEEKKKLNRKIKRKIKGFVEKKIKNPEQIKKTKR